MKQLHLKKSPAGINKGYSWYVDDFEMMPYTYASFPVNVRSALASCVSIQYFFKNLLEC